LPGATVAKAVISPGPLLSAAKSAAPVASCFSRTTTWLSRELRPGRQDVGEDVDRGAVGRLRRRRDPHDVEPRQARERVVDRAAALGGVRRFGQVRPLRIRLARDHAEVLLDERHRSSSGRGRPTIDSTALFGA
jgi:hypothetical protein